jgi:hypothetical protein
MFSNFVYWLEYWGVRDIILPFILIFTIFFAVLQKIHLFGDKDKKYNVVLSLAIALLVIIPHVTGYYPQGFDVVNTINDSIPEVALLTIIVVLLLFMVGLAGGTVPSKSPLTAVLALASCAILLLIFANQMTPVPFLEYIDPSIQALIVILLVFGLIVWFVTREDTASKPLTHFIWGGGSPPPQGGGAHP